MSSTHVGSDLFNVGQPSFHNAGTEVEHVLCPQPLASLLRGISPYSSTRDDLAMMVKKHSVLMS